MDKALRMCGEIVALNRESDNTSYVIKSFTTRCYKVDNITIRLAASVATLNWV